MDDIEEAIVRSVLRERIYFHRGHESNPEIVKELEYILNKLSHMVDKPREEDSGEKR